ncbi:hypothetical protein SARC_06891 [Sphaeroforma arctica JP610]|uniref:Uncharacterized protein n=1 Tax=Sphaeroforma arctica JP610 TaxID=667725 RepID=A0A0L0FVU4_9EUKA|nr:hypothetical protein SARC_06891 [Sphaeroforma arctica JP610]KNC80764.1 hypothetical protein SARC_06891 [Sphaeroforma arctica JP610]|eukprot:XP_014154666.1 hypothetical protein SARC_06891 [Sphaeroforma arctica JP610]
MFTDDGGIYLVAIVGCYQKAADDVFICVTEAREVDALHECVAKRRALFLGSVLNRTTAMPPYAECILVRSLKIDEEIKSDRTVVLGGHVAGHVFEVKQHRPWIFDEFDGGHGVDDFIVERSKEEKTSLLWGISGDIEHVATYMLVREDTFEVLAEVHGSCHGEVGEPFVVVGIVGFEPGPLDSGSGAFA